MNMATQKPVNEINTILSTILDKPFMHRGEIADYLEIHPSTLRKWVENSMNGLILILTIAKPHEIKLLMQVASIIWNQNSSKAIILTISPKT